MKPDLIRGTNRTSKRPNRFVYDWLRSHEEEYLQYINIAMGDNRGLFCDSAYRKDYADFWCVADKDLGMEKFLLHQGDVFECKIAKNFNQQPLSMDILIPNWKNEFTLDWQKDKEPWDDELEQAMKLAYVSLEKASERTRFMKSIRI
jgi:hypothetical protein